MTETICQTIAAAIVMSSQLGATEAVRQNGVAASVADHRIGATEAVCQAATAGLTEVARQTGALCRLLEAQWTAPSIAMVCLPSSVTTRECCMPAS